MTPLPPGSTIGILGGGQLGRMLAIAAAQLGSDVAIFTWFFSHSEARPCSSISESSVRMFCICSRVRTAPQIWKIFEDLSCVNTTNLGLNVTTAAIWMYLQKCLS